MFGTGFVITFMQASAFAQDTFPDTEIRSISCTALCCVNELKKSVVAGGFFLYRTDNDTSF